MSLETLRPLADHLWQSTAFLAAAALLTVALRKNRARVRHGVWMLASSKFLIPMSVLVTLGGEFSWRRPSIEPPPILVVANQVSQPFGQKNAVAPPVPAAPARTDALPMALPGIWACGFIGIACAWGVRWRRIRATARAGLPVDLGLSIPTISSSTLMEPGVFGIVHPALLLPDRIVEHLSPAQLNAVIAHELCHVRYRDNLAAAFHMFVETVFWFHPLVWWIGKRMVAEREQACDEEVLRLGTEPNVYAEGILRVCTLYVEAPLICVSGITGSNLKKRVQAILSGRVGADLSPARKAILTSLGMLCLGLPALMGVVNEASLPLVPPSGVKFRSVTIERCKTGAIWGSIESPARGELIANCLTTTSLIYLAWLNSPVGDPLFIARISYPAIPLSEAPVWVGSGNYRYRIDARADPGASLATMEGPMLQSLLADRFGLKIRRVTRESPMYALRVVKGGPRLQPATEGVCSGGVSAGGMFGMPPPNCFPYPMTGSLQYEKLDGQALTLSDFCRLLPLGRPVVDKTGIEGRFDFHLVFAGVTTPAALLRLYPPLPDLLETRLGLTLDPFTGPREFLVVDQISKPLPE